METASSIDLFPLGRVVTSAKAAAKVNPIDIYHAINQHRRGNWGAVSLLKAVLNNAAIQSGGRIFSAYVDRRGTEFWVITEADRTMTNVYLAEW